MDNAMHRSTSIPTLEPLNPRRRRPHHVRDRPVSRISQLNEDDLITFDTQRDRSDYQPQPHAQAVRRASNASCGCPADSNQQRAERIQSPLYQTVIPAFNPNHYDVSNTNVCLCIPFPIKTPLTKLRQRRRSAQELRAHDEELRNEYSRLKHIEAEFRGDLPPYEEARKNGIHVRNQGIERPRTAAIPQFGLNQGALANRK